MRRQSKHRNAVTTLIAEAGGPLSAEEVRDVLSDTGIGVATVYRLLNEGVEDGRFKLIEMPHGPARYEPSDRPHHHHFHCRDCGRVYDIEGCPGGIGNLVPKGFTLDDHEIVMYGRCDACQEK